MLVFSASLLYIRARFIVISMHAPPQIYTFAHKKNSSCDSFCRQGRSTPKILNGAMAKWEETVGLHEKRSRMLRTDLIKSSIPTEMIGGALKEHGDLRSVCGAYQWGVILGRSGHLRHHDRQFGEQVFFFFGSQ